MGIVNLDHYRAHRAAALRLAAPEILAFAFRRGLPIVGRIGDLRGKRFQRARLCTLIWAARFDSEVRPISSILFEPSEAWMSVERLDLIDQRRKAIVGEIPPAVRLALNNWYGSPRVTRPAYEWLLQILDEIAPLEQCRSFEVTRERIRLAMNEPVPAQTDNAPFLHHQEVSLENYETV